MGTWSDCSNTPRWFDGSEYRVKPETVRYRVSLHQDFVGRFYTMVSDGDEEAEGNHGTQFIRWLTDWQEVEV